MRFFRVSPVATAIVVGAIAPARVYSVGLYGAGTYR